MLHWVGKVGLAGVAVIALTAAAITMAAPAQGWRGRAGRGPVW
jgi:hypothetical protein